MNEMDLKLDEIYQRGPGVDIRSSYPPGLTATTALKEPILPFYLPIELEKQTFIHFFYVKLRYD